MGRAAMRAREAEAKAARKGKRKEVISSSSDDSSSASKKKRNKKKKKQKKEKSKKAVKKRQRSPAPNLRRVDALQHEKPRRRGASAHGHHGAHRGIFVSPCA